MKIEALLSFFEHLSHGLTALLIALVCSATLAAGYVPLRSGIDPARVESDLAILRWIQEQAASSSTIVRPRARDRFEDLSISESGSAARSAERAAPTSPNAPRGSAPSSSGASPAEDLSTRPSDEWPESERAPGVPWLRREAGVRFRPPVLVPESLAERYRSVEGASELIREPRGQFLEQADGSSTFQFSSIPKSSHLSQVVGLQPGDKLISVNGHKIQGVGFAAAKAIYEQVRDAERFALKIEREGRFEVLTFTIKRNSRP